MSQKKKSMLLFLVVALLLVLSLVAVFFLNSHNEQGEIARIYQDGKLIREVSLTVLPVLMNFRWRLRMAATT